MPLDRENGERLESFENCKHVVIDARAVAEMTGLKIKYQVKNKFKLDTMEAPVFDHAVSRAISAFVSAGALLPIAFDETCILAQVYPKQQTLAMIFQWRVAGDERLFAQTYRLPQDAIGRLLGEQKKATAH